MQHMGVCPSSETRRKRDHSEGEKKGENYVSPLFRVMMLTFVQGLSVSRRCERASERASRARPRMREICFFCERDNRRIQKDPQTSNTHPDASSLDKEDGWEFAYLLHVTCAH